MKIIRPQQQFMLSFGFICRLHLFLLAFVFYLLLHSLAAGYEPKEEKRVLILFAAQSDLPTYQLVEKGIKSSLKAGMEYRIEYFIEYMDSYRKADPSLLRKIIVPEDWDIWDSHSGFRCRVSGKGDVRY